MRRTSLYAVLLLAIALQPSMKLLCVTNCRAAVSHGSAGAEHQECPSDTSVPDSDPAGPSRDAPGHGPCDQPSAFCGPSTSSKAALSKFSPGPIAFTAPPLRLSLAPSAWRPASPGVAALRSVPLRSLPLRV